MPLPENPADGRSRPNLIAVWYCIGVLLLLVVASLSLMRVPDIGINDKLSHVTTYFMLAGWFGLLAVNRSVLAWTFAAVIAYGGLIELLQAMTPYRQAEWADLLANSIGAAFGICLYFTPLRRLLLLVDRRLAEILRR